jgi:purine-binding chemotaxis protein CheW
MDIAKIRTKALSKETEHKPEETQAVVCPAGEKNGEIQDKIPPVIYEPVHDTGGEVPPVSDNESDKKMDGPEKNGSADDEETILELLTFSLENEEFAFRLSEVEEIIRHQVITRVPCMSDYVLGITSLRGKIIPVIDLKQKLVLRGQVAEKHDKDDIDISEADSAIDHRKILIISGPKGLIGASIEKVMGVVRFPEGSVLDPPSNLIEEERKYIEGVVILEKRFISIVRAEEALNIEVN